MGNLLTLIPRRHGHFLLESGHHGDLWLDLDALFLYPGALTPHVSALAAALVEHEVEAVCGPLTGGAFVAHLVAVDLDVAFCYTERVVQPGVEGTSSVEYRLPSALGAAVAGRRIAVVDDAINAGSAVDGTLAVADRRMRCMGRRLLGSRVRVKLAPDRADPPTFDGLPLVALANLPARLWIPGDCPLCAARVPLDPVANG